MSEPLLPPFDHKPRPYVGPTRSAVLAGRRQHLTPSLFTLYGDDPLMIVEGFMQYVFDETGRRYLDGFGGIATIGVGHCHPHVTGAAREQLERLQHATTIYLHPTIVEYGAMLASKMPPGLDVCYFVNSGSEANDLAVLLARLYTGNYDIVALRNAYHGGVATALGLTAHSTWKFNVPQGFGIHHVRNPDPYRGPWGAADPEAGSKYAADVQDLIAHATPGRVAGFFAESIQGVGGVTMYPPGYLATVYETVRAAGGVCVSDEVQAGFGRTGAHFWGFEHHGVIPDIVTMAKSIGNGAPLAAVVTRREIAEKLAERVHFNTYGGNPVSCAMGKAVLEVIEREALQQNAREVGGYLIDRLRGLQERQPLIGDVRGMGFMVGVDLVQDRGTKEPASAACARVLQGCRQRGLLLGKGGLRGNVIRVKPPLCLTRADVDFIVEVLDVTLREAVS
ncbi:MAG: aspartate aminotransferase family protein [Planctomycetota bacterium]